MIRSRCCRTKHSVKLGINEGQCLVRAVQADENRPNQALGEEVERWCLHIGIDSVAQFAQSRRVAEVGDRNRQDASVSVAKLLGIRRCDSRGRKERDVHASLFAASRVDREHHRGSGTDQVAAGGLTQRGDGGLEPGQHAFAHVRQREQQHLPLGRKVVLHSTHRHAGLLSDIAQAHRLEPARADDGEDGLGQEAAALLVVDLLRHAPNLSHASALQSEQQNVTMRSHHKIREAGMGIEYAVNGDARIAYETFGTAGEPLLLVLGLDFQMVWWPDAFCERLVEAGYHVARYDNRDTGLSTHYPQPADGSPWRALLGGTRPLYTMADMIGDGLAVMDALGWADAHVLGGTSAIAQGMALLHPGRVRGLTLCMSSPATAGLLCTLRYLKFGIFREFRKLPKA
ncbi:MAG: hypothetical protein QOE61_3906, partial [Micromonosporaceae bacterium]|nr:hypothetical protein [Micromonosporaceae bacterium]